MRNYVWLLLMFLFFLGSCIGEKTEILVPDNYADWERLTKEELNYFIPGHESHYRISYINKIGQEVEITKDVDGKNVYNYKKGTIIIKEIYPTLTLREGDEPIMLTVMVKNPDHHNAQGGWVWIVKPLDSNEEVQFKSDMCVNCHAGANGRHPYNDENPNEEFRDYVFFPWHK